MLYYSFSSIEINSKSFWIGSCPNAISPDQSEPGIDGNERVLHITQSSSVTGTSPSNCFVSYSGHPLSSAEKFVYSTSLLQPTRQPWDGGTEIAC